MPLVDATKFKFRIRPSQAALQCGFFAGVLLLVAFGAATDYSVRLLIDLGVRSCPVFDACGLSARAYTPPAAAPSRAFLRRPLRKGAPLRARAMLVTWPLVVAPPLSHRGQAFGTRGFYLATFLLIAISFGAELAYLTIIGAMRT